MTLKDKAALLAFNCGGRIPWSRGYSTFRRMAIERSLVLDVASMRDRALPVPYGGRIDERIIEYVWLAATLRQNEYRILDAGSTLNQPQMLDAEFLRERELYSLTLAPEAPVASDRTVSRVYGDLRDTCFRDAFFDAIACLSTLEHVGMDNTVLYTADRTKQESDATAFLTAIDELRRIVRPGGSLYLTVPFGRRADLGWFQVFDAARLDEAINRFTPNTVEARYFSYQHESWRETSRENCRDAGYTEWSTTTSPNAPAAAHAVACVRLEK